MSSVISLSLNPRDIFQISSSLTFFICKTIDCSFWFFKIILSCFVVLYTCCSESHFSFLFQSLQSPLYQLYHKVFFVFYFLLSLVNLICTRVSITICFLMIHNYLFPFQISLNSGSEFLLIYSTLLGYFQSTSNLSCSKLFFCTSSLFFKNWSSAITPYLSQSPSSLKCPPPTH